MSFLLGLYGSAPAAVPVPSDPHSRSANPKLFGTRLTPAMGSRYPGDIWGTRQPRTYKQGVYRSEPERETTVLIPLQLVWYTCHPSPPLELNTTVLTLPLKAYFGHTVYYFAYLLLSLLGTHIIFCFWLGKQMDPAPICSSLWLSPGRGLQPRRIFSGAGSSLDLQLMAKAVRSQLASDSEMDQTKILKTVKCAQVPNTVKSA